MLDSPILGSNKWDYFGKSASISSDGKTFSAGSADDRECCVKIFTFSSIANRWNQLRTSIVIVAVNDKFRSSVSISSDGNTVIAGYPHDSENGKDSGHVQTFIFSSNTNNWD